MLLIWLTVGLCVAPTDAYELKWLLSGPVQDGPARYNARDLSHAQAATTGQPYDPYLNLRLCNSERVCGRREFCDVHYGVCREQGGEGQACRNDDMCHRGLDCMFGKCQPQVERGREGARCRKDRDCHPGMCCARRNGQPVCQARLPLGHKCFVPEGGPDYAMNERCPCEEGLICKYTSPDPPSSNPAITFWSAYENMRCVPPSHSPHAS